jgi:hypothetical protein
VSISGRCAPTLMIITTCTSRQSLKSLADVVLIAACRLLLPVRAVFGTMTIEKFLLQHSRLIYPRRNRNDPDQPQLADHEHRQKATARRRSSRDTRG